MSFQVRMTVTFNFRYSTELTAEELKARVLEILDRHGLVYDIKWTHSGLPFLTPVGELVNAAKNAIRNVTGVETELSTSRRDIQMVALLLLQVLKYLNLVFSMPASIKLMSM